eukprot:GHVT01059661.1.p1 GENE.GHVT01059661.1~~GHVT01059661.1.p1  ORF type:complete len:799 (-),score=71.08 GHVT01059661.1:3585-5981(-)
MKVFETVARWSLFALIVAAIPAFAAPSDVSIEDPRVGRCTENELQSVTMYFNENPEQCAAYECLERQTKAFVTKVNEQYTDLHTEEEVNQLANMFAACYCRCELMKCEIDFFVENGSSECRAATRDYCEASDEKFIDRCTAAATARPLVYDLMVDEAGFQRPCTVCGSVVEPPLVADYPTIEGSTAPLASSEIPPVVVQPPSDDPFANAIDLTDGSDNFFPVSAPTFEAEAPAEAAAFPTATNATAVSGETTLPTVNGNNVEMDLDSFYPPTATDVEAPASSVLEGAAAQPDATAVDAPVKEETIEAPWWEEIETEKESIVVESAPPKDDISGFLLPSPTPEVVIPEKQIPSDGPVANPIPVESVVPEPEEEASSTPTPPAAVVEQPELVVTDIPSTEPTVAAPVVTEAVVDVVTPPVVAPNVEGSDPSCTYIGTWMGVRLIRFSFCSGDAPASLQLSFNVRIRLNGQQKHWCKMCTPRLKSTMLEGFADSLVPKQRKCLPLSSTNCDDVDNQSAVGLAGSEDCSSECCESRASDEVNLLRNLFLHVQTPPCINAQTLSYRANCLSNSVVDHNFDKSNINGLRGWAEYSARPTRVFGCGNTQAKHLQTSDGRLVFLVALKHQDWTLHSTIPGHETQVKPSSAGAPSRLFPTSCSAPRTEDKSKAQLIHGEHIGQCWAEPRSAQCRRRGSLAARRQSITASRSARGGTSKTTGYCRRNAATSGLSDTEDARSTWRADETRHVPCTIAETTVAFSLPISFAATAHLPVDAALINMTSACGDEALHTDTCDFMGYSRLVRS